jgi:hypothetical protein
MAQESEKHALFQHVLWCLDQPQTQLPGCPGPAQVFLFGDHQRTLRSADDQHGSLPQFASLTMAIRSENNRRTGSTNQSAAWIDLPAASLASPPLAQQLAWGISWGAREAQGEQDDLQEGLGVDSDVVHSSNGSAVGNGQGRLGLPCEGSASSGVVDERFGRSKRSVRQWSRLKLASLSVLEAGRPNDSRDIDLRTGANLVKRCLTKLGQVRKGSPPAGRQLQAQPVRGLSYEVSSSRVQDATIRAEKQHHLDAIQAGASNLNLNWGDPSTSSSAASEEAVRSPTVLFRGFQRLELLPVWENDGSRRKQYAWDGRQILAVDPPDEDEIMGRNGDPLKQAWKQLESFLKRAFIPEVRGCAYFCSHRFLFIHCKKWGKDLPF